MKRNSSLKKMTSKIQRSQQKMLSFRVYVFFCYLYVHIDNALLSIEFCADFFGQNMCRHMPSFSCSTQLNDLPLLFPLL